MADPKINIVMDAVDKTQGKMDAVGAEGERMAGRMKAVGMAMVAVGAAVSAALIKAIDSVKEFNRHIEATAITAGATGKDIERMKEKALELGDALVPAEEVSEGFSMLMRITQDTGQALEYMSGFVDLVKYTGDDLAGTIGKVTDAMGQFGLEMSDTNRIMDTAVAIHSQSSWAVGEVLDTMVSLAPAANVVGLGMDELSSIMGSMAKSGMSAASTTQSVSYMFTKLVDDSAEVRDAMAGLGVAVYTSDGKLRDMTDILGETMDAFAGLEGGAEKAMYATEIFGLRAGTKVANFASEGSAALTNFNEALETSAGMTQELAAVAEDSISPWARFKNTIHETSLKFGAVTEPIAGVLSGLSALLMPVGMLMMMYPSLAAGVSSFNIAQKLSAISTKLITAATWLWNAALYANPLVWIIALIIAVIAVGVLLIKNWDKVKGAVGAFAKGAKEKLGEFGSFMKDSAKKWVKMHVAAFNKLKDGAKKAWEGIKKGGETIKNWLKDKFSKWFDMKKKMFEMGKALMQKLKEGMEAMKKKLKETAGNIADSIKDFFGGSLPEVGPLRHIVEYGEDLMRGYGRGMVRGASLTRADLAAVMSGAGGTTRTTSFNTTLNVPMMGSFDDGQLDRLYRRLEQLELSKARRATP